jgi:hypothetical protein
MQEIEHHLETHGQDVYSNPHYNDKRGELIFQLAQINTVCNMNGKGRDDLTDIEILLAAEQIPFELKQGQAQSI